MLFEFSLLPILYIAHIDFAVEAGADSVNSWDDATVLHLQPWGETTQLGNTVHTMLDKDYFYVSFDMDEPEMDKVVASQRKHDDLSMWEDNGVEIFLDPEGGRKNYYHIPESVKDFKVAFSIPFSL